MDALVMSGEGLRAGAVAAIKNVQNPVKVARLVLEKTPHMMLAGEGGRERERDLKNSGENKEKKVPNLTASIQQVKEPISLLLPMATHRCHQTHWSPHMQSMNWKLSRNSLSLWIVFSTFCSE